MPGGEPKKTSDKKAGPVAGMVRDMRIFLIAGEHSGDALGGKLMRALSNALEGRVSFHGVGGQAMERQGLKSLFSLDDIAVMGPLSILKRFPTIAKRVYQTIDAAVAEKPDSVVIIDSPEFTHPIAKRIRKRAPQIPIIDYVSPSIWAWRSGRARKMKPYVDHVLALLPFEPDAHEKYGGPRCTYVGHPLTERQEWMRALDPGGMIERMGLSQDDVILAMLPGSRTSEVKRLMKPFGETLALLQGRGHDIKIIMPVIKTLRPLIEHFAKDWPQQPLFLESEDDKFRAFKASKAALAASGTVTLELALSGTPMVVAYKVDPLAARLRFLLNVHSVVLANLVLGENVFPECLQERCTPDIMADAVEDLLSETPARKAQLEALKKIPQVMAHEGLSPSDHAAQIIKRYALKTPVR